MSSRIAFIDSSISNYSEIVAGLPPDTYYYFIAPDSDGLQQIQNYLFENFNYSGIYLYDAIDIFTFGAPGKVTLGSTVLTTDSLSDYSDNFYALTNIGSWLASDADILLYGSNVAQGSAGQEFIERVAEITGVDVAASTNVTGSVLLGGDWILEASAGYGTIDTLPVAPDFSGTLGDGGTIASDNSYPPLPVHHLAGVDVQFSYTIPVGTFSDDTGNPLVNYFVQLDDGAGNLSPLPDWLIFDFFSGTFSGTPAGSDNTGLPLSIRITATGDFGTPEKTALIDLRVVAPRGTPNSDTIYGSIYIDPASPGTDYILGLSGSDQIYGFGGDDILYGNGDAGSYYGDQSFIYGGDGNDSIYGDPNGYYEYLYGENGNDTIYAGINSSNSELLGGSGDDLLVGGNGGDRLYGDDGSDRLYGGDGNDDLYGSSQWYGDTSQDLIYGGDGDDSIHYTAGYGSSATVVGGGGRDVYWLTNQQGELIAVDFEVGANGDVLQIGDILSNYLDNYDSSSNPFETGHLQLTQDGADTLLQYSYDPSYAYWQTLIRLQNVNATTLTQENFGPQVNPIGGVTNPVVFVGTSADETVSGSIVDDTIDGGGGKDTLYGYAGNDVIVMNGSNPGYSYSYDASIYGGAGDDTLSAGDNFNGYYLHIYGESGNDTIGGSLGIDYLEGGAGSDVISGYDGDDQISDYGDIAGDLTTIYGGGGNDSIQYSSYDGGTAAIYGGDGNDSITASNYSSGLGTVTVTVEGGGGSDVYRLNSQAVTLISTDFAAGSGGDIVYINDLLSTSNWLEGQGNPFADGAYHYLRLVSADPGAPDQNNVGTALQWDRDGAGTVYDWQTVIDMPNVQWKFGSHGLTFDNFAPKADPFGGSDGVTLTGTTGVDTLYGSVVADVIDGAGGGYSEQIYGYGGNDEIYADRYGSNGSNTNYAYLYGGTGNDTLWANAFASSGWNVLYGQAGDDELNGSNLRDYLYGEAGNDTIFGGGGDDYIQNYGGVASDIDLIDAGAGNDSLYFYDASQVTVTGGTGADTYNLNPYAGLVTVKDFEPYQPGSGSLPAIGDVLYIQDLLSASSNYSNLSGNPFGSGHLQWAANAGSIDLQWDQDGAAGPASFKSVIRLEGIQEIDLLPGNYAPTLDGVTIRTITVTDGYVKGAAIYFDTDADGVADQNEYSGAETDEFGNFNFTSTHTEAIIAVGGINIDTGLANLMTLKAPNSATTVNPLTTLVQTYLETQTGATLEQATLAVSDALGLPAGVDILTYDPLAQAADDPTALAVQKIAVQVAAVAVLSGNPAEAIKALTEVIANQPQTLLDLTDPAVLDPILDEVATPEAIEKIVAANQAVADAASLDGVSDVQKEYFSEAPNAAPVWDETSPTLSGQEGQKLTIFAVDLLTGWSDPNGNPISVVNLTAPNGTLVNNNDGTWFFTPNVGFSGAVEFSYQVTDGVLSSPATASLTIEGVNDSPVITLGGNASSNEGALYTLALSAIDSESASQTLSYSINWGDGGTPEVLTATQLAGSGGNVDHVYVDDPDTALNYVDRTISVTVTDPDGGAAVAEQTVRVNNVAPTIEITGESSVAEDSIYTLTLGDVTDPGLDKVTGYVVNWGDGTTEETFTSAGAVTHLYADPGDYAIDVDLGDEDGLHVSAGTLALTVNAAPTTETVRIGDAPARVTSTSQFVAAWSNPLVTGIVHTANASVDSPTWSAVKLSLVNVGTLAGGDIYNGDLGVSGQTQATSTVKQEIDGTEALRFNLETEATGVTVDLSRFFANDDGLGQSEAGRLRLFGANGEVVRESTFVADGATGERTISLGAAEGFTAVELSAGLYDDGIFVFGGYANVEGGVGSTSNATATHGSDFMVDWIEFEVPIDVVGVAPQLDYSA